MKLLILGGTTFLGPHLVEAARGHEVTLFHRSAVPPNLAGDRDPEVGRGLRSLEGTRWDAVIDTSGYHPGPVRASARLLRSAFYLFVSTISVYAGHVPGQTEDAPTLPPGDDYGAGKAACERAVREECGQACIVRPGLIVGPGDPTDRFTYWPARLHRGGEILAPGDGSDPIQVVDARDLARWLVELAIRRHTGTFHAVGPERRTPMAELLAACGEGRLTWVDSGFLQRHEVAPWTDLPVWIPASDPEHGGHNQLDNGRARAAGLRLRPLEETCADTLAWWLRQPEERRGRPRHGLSPEREAELLRAYRE